MSNNILVNWKVNTDEVAKSRDVLNQAQQAADKYTQTATKGGNESAKAFGKNQKSIDDMRIRLKELKTIMDTLPQTATKRLAQYSAEYKKLDAEVRKVTKDLYEQEKAAKSVGSATQNNTKLFGQLGNTIKAVLTVTAVKQAVGLSLEMAKLSGNVEGVERAFNRAFPDAPLLLSNLQRATHGAVSEFELMQRTLQATNLGVAVESLPVLFEFAAARAQQTGESVDYLVDSIVRGIGRKSILVLDNLGLSATRLREQFNGASLASQSVADVTRGVAEIAKVELEKMGGFAETAATKVDQLSVSWSNLGKEISELATQDGGLIDFFKSYTDSFALLVEAQNKGISVSELAAQKLREHNAEFSANLFFQTAFTKNKEENIKVLDAEIQRLTRSVGAWASLKDQMEAQNKEDQDRINLLKVSSGLHQDEIIALGQDIAFRSRLVNVKREETLEDQEVLKLLLMRMAALKEIVPLTEKLGLIAQKEAEIEGVNDALKAAKSTTEIHNLNIELEKLNGELADLKAFGTTKRQLIVNGQLKLVPVLAPKGSEGKLSSTKTIDFSRQLQDMVDEIIASGILTIPIVLKPSDQAITPMTDSERIGQEFADNWKSILSQGISDTTNFLDSVVQAEADSYDQRLNQTRAYYDEQVMLAGDNERAKDELRIKGFRQEQKLRREAFEADKRAKKASAAINGAAGIINAFATLPYPAAVVAAALIAAETVAQIAVIDRQRPKFAKGVIDLKGPGTKTSDSINAKLSKGESVMTADETGSARGILNDIRAGKLNDKKLARQLDSAVLRDLKITKDGIKMVGMDDSRIVKKLDQLMNAQPDYIEKSGVLWKTKQKSENYKKWVRAKIM